MNNIPSKLPTSYWIIAYGALIWNLIGVGSFFNQVFIGQEVLEAMSEPERAMYEAFPAWMEGVYAIAVLTGVFGSIGLVMRKAWSVPLLLISFVFVIIQMGYSFFFTEALEVYGPPAMILPTLVVLIAGYLYFFAKRRRALGWLT